MKRFMILSLLAVTFAATFAPLVPAFADQHKDNMIARCQREKC